jgi:hypothetical protein
VKDNFEEAIDFAVSAEAHGVERPDAMHALRNSIKIWEMDEEFEMHIGSGRSGQLLEIGLIQRGSRMIVIHAMAARTKFLGR